MTLFWTISAVMMLAALALLAPTLLRQHRAADDDTESQNVAIARERLAELEKARKGGELSDEEFAQGRQDLELALAEDLEGTRGPMPSQRQGGGRIALLSAALLVPLITVPLYLQIGSPQLIEAMPGNHAAMGGHTGQGDQMPPISELAERLRQRMEADPDNAEGWFLLGRTYMRLQSYADAVYAFEKVVALLPEDPAGLMSLADATTMRDGGQIGARSIELLEKALRIDPNSVTALWLLGNSAADDGDTAKALDYWQRAYPLLAEDPRMQANLGQRITAAGGTLPTSAAPPALPPIMTAPAQSAPPTGTAGTAGATIQVQVALAPALLEKAAPQDTLFVLARAESGPPMPLAVARHRVDDLPLEVTLSDAMAMMPQMKLSSFPRVKVSAIVSKRGAAGTQAGDLVASDQVVETANPPENVQLLIDTVVQ